MIALIQRVKNASVSVENTIVGSIDSGILIFLGIHSRDSHSEVDWLVRKCINLRIFPNQQGQMNLSVQNISGEILLVSQFTLYGNTSKGHRPSFTEAARPELAKPLYEYVNASLQIVVDFFRSSADFCFQKF